MYKFSINDENESLDSISTSTSLLLSLDASFAKIDIPTENFTYNQIVKGELNTIFVMAAENGKLGQVT